MYKLYSLELQIFQFCLFPFSGGVLLKLYTSSPVAEVKLLIRVFFFF